MTSTSAWLARLAAASPDVELLPAAPPHVVVEAQKALRLPDPLIEILAFSNGLVCRSFRLYSVFDKTNIKKTSESLQQANEPGKTDAVGGDPDLLKRFVVIADIGNGFALLDRSDGSLWFQEVGVDDLQQTTLSLQEFIETMVANAE